jgi:hypothetical protein
MMVSGRSQYGSFDLKYGARQRKVTPIRAEISHFVASAAVAYPLPRPALRGVETSEARSLEGWGEGL